MENREILKGELMHMSNKTFTYEHVFCKEVTDGDTIKVIIDRGFGDFSTRNIRLKGLDTPESKTKNLLEKKSRRICKINN